MRRPELAMIDGVRARLATSVQSRIRGPQGARVIAEVFDPTNGPGWFEPDAIVRVVHSDTAMFIGGVRALLLQSLHPSAMAAMVDHSIFGDDPWGRVQRTSEFILRTTFGSAQQAEEVCRRIRAVHATVTGETPDGRPYRADDPHLLAWVHAAEVDSFLEVYRRYGAMRLDAGERARYVAEMARVGRELGVVDPPTDVAGLTAVLETYRPELARTPGSAAAARLLLRHPPLPRAGRPMYAVLATAALSSLPMWAQGMVAVPVAPPADAVLVRPAARMVVATLRWALAPRPAA